ncbi:hypothetical protein NARC_70081 [Candidatus Nitrosocosmicus arcticus]|uniref:Uncharacterized protein n=1 Tax=Candidatus Nitrosocosmicus arcticus TaxID=2035267 RepID=A0A557SV87_9ARCH|nr:hypothetical protein NARC_70081 [Candidatus Nitrosocosmicus arcticus]
MLKKNHERSPIIPLTSGANTNVKPTINQRVDSKAIPVIVCIITDKEFFNLINPASKKPRAGVIKNTNPVQINIHVVSPVSIANGHKRFTVDYKVFPFLLKNFK